MSVVVTGIDQENQKKCDKQAWISKGLQAQGPSSRPGSAKAYRRGDRHQACNPLEYLPDPASYRWGYR